MNETLRLPRNSQTMFMKMLRLPRILLHQRKTHCAHHEKRAAVSQNAALAMEFCGNTQIRRSARRHSERAVLKKGPFHAKLSHARQLFATTAMVLELRLSKRRSLTRQEDITAWRPCHQKTHFGLKKTRLARGFLKKHGANLPRTCAFPRPCQQNRKMHTAPPRTSPTVRPCQQKCILLRKMCTAPQRERTHQRAPNFVRDCCIEDHFLRTGPAI